MEFHEAQDVKGRKAVSYDEAELADVQNALRVLKSQASVRRSAVRSAIEGLDCLQGDLAIVSAKIQVAKGALISPFDHLSRNFSNMQTAQTAVLERKIFILRSYILTELH